MVEYKKVSPYYLQATVIDKAKNNLLRSTWVKVVGVCYWENHVFVIHDEAENSESGKLTISERYTMGNCVNGAAYRKIEDAIEALKVTLRGKVKMDADEFEVAKNTFTRTADKVILKLPVWIM